VILAGQLECNVSRRKHSCKGEENINWTLKKCGVCNECLIEYCIHKIANIALLIRHMYVSAKLYRLLSQMHIIFYDTSC
jgi:hypothetical protein